MTSTTTAVQIRLNIFSSLISDKSDGNLVKII
jgi:hypothetical protein